MGHKTIVVEMSLAGISTQEVARPIYRSAEAWWTSSCAYSTES